MGDLEQKLDGILRNPEAMSQIMQLAQSLHLGDSGQASQSSETQTNVSEHPASSETAPSAPSQGSLPGLSALDPGMLSAAAKLLGDYQSGQEDQRVALLMALKPFVREERYAKLDKAVQIARLSRLIRSALELFRPKGENHV